MRLQTYELGLNHALQLIYEFQVTILRSRVKTRGRVDARSGDKTVARYGSALDDTAVPVAIERRQHPEVPGAVPGAPPSTF